VDFRVSKYKQIILGNPPCQNIMDFQCFRNCHCPNRRRLMPNCTKHVTVIAVYSHSFTWRKSPPPLMGHCSLFHYHPPIYASVS
jgi:hypothetical protein